MAEGSKNSSNSAPKHMLGIYPVQTTMTAKKGSKGESSYQQKSQITFGDKQSGSYTRTTAIDKASSGDFCWKNGTSGVKDEHKKSVTVRISDPQGYTKVYREERFCKVTFDNNSESESESESESDTGVCYDKYGGSNTYSDDNHYNDYDSNSDDGYHACGCSYDSDSDY